MIEYNGQRPQPRGCRLSVVYRPFRNSDPPALVQIWNEALPSRGSAFLPSSVPLEIHVLSKPYFDPQGLIIAHADGQAVGFAHAGFAGNADGGQLDPSVGVICAVMVRPAHRQKNIGAELLQRAEEYLRSRGAKTIFAGTMRPYAPFYWGIYGGSEPPGVLISDIGSWQFLQANQYVPADSCVVLSRELETQCRFSDARFYGLRKKFEMEVQGRPVGGNWYQECVLAPLEISQFRLVEKATAKPVARAWTWEMDLYAWRSHQSAVGIIDLEVDPNYRRQGLGKFLLAQMLQDLGDQCFAHVEVQIKQDNANAIRLLQSLGFSKVDEGRSYRKESVVRSS